MKNGSISFNLYALLMLYLESSGFFVLFLFLRQTRDFAKPRNTNSRRVRADSLGSLILTSALDRGDWSGSLSGHFIHCKKPAVHNK